MTNDAMHCDLPPAGWTCTRDPSHDGQCAAVPISWLERAYAWLTKSISTEVCVKDCLSPCCHFRCEGKSNRTRPATVEYRYPDSGFPELRAWREYGSYPNTQTAQEVVANKTRSATTAEYRIKT